MRRDLDGWPIEVPQHSVQKILTEMERDERLARRVQAAEGRTISRANQMMSEMQSDQEQSMHEDDVENSQSSAKSSGDGNRDQSGAGEMQVEGRAPQTSAQGVRRLAEALLHRGSDTRARSSNEPL